MLSERYPHIKRVAAYCRVSTDNSDQVNSLKTQKSFFQEYITRNPGWELIGIYADEGITGTSTKKRRAFNKMIADAELGAFDLIITKDLSRFARNTLDSIFYTRKLKELNIGVCFLNDNIFTLDADSELRLTIMSSIAQEESRKTSERVKWGQRRRMEAGSAFGLHVLGYDKSKGNLTVNENEAVIIRRIFRDFLSGKGITTIANELENEGCKTKTGKNVWYPSAIYRILQNEKYCGDILSKKTITPNYLEHVSKPNKGQEDQIYIQNNHEAIISREMFEKVQRIIKERAHKKNTESYRYANRYPFSGKIKCGACGSSFTRRSLYARHGNPRIEWQCKAKTRYGKKKINAQGAEIGCDNLSIPEKMLQDIFISALKYIPMDQAAIKDEILSSITNLAPEGHSLDAGNNRHKLLIDIKTLAEKKKSAIDAFLAGVITAAELKEMKEMYHGQIELLYKKLNQQDDTPVQDGLIQITDRIDGLLVCTEFNDALCDELLEKMIIYNKSHIEIYMKEIKGSFIVTASEKEYIVHYMA